MLQNIRNLSKAGAIIAAVFFGIVSAPPARAFVHPGGLHTLADLERMRTNVVAGNHPWIDDWQQLLCDPQSQSNWKPAAQANLGVSRQRADLDAHAAYLNALRWYISGDTNNAECAVRICNAWSRNVNQLPHGEDIPGLSGIPIFDFALAGELLRIYPGWNAQNFNAFTNMMVKYFYPQCHGFLSNHDGRCISYFWANWDACNIGSLIAMGVLCDDTNIFNEGINYFKHGQGNGPSRMLFHSFILAISASGRKAAEIRRTRNWASACLAVPVRWHGTRAWTFSAARTIVCWPARNTSPNVISRIPLRKFPTRFTITAPMPGSLR